MNQSLGRLHLYPQNIITSFPQLCQRVIGSRSFYTSLHPFASLRSLHYTLCITTITTLHPLHHYDHYTTPFASLRYEGVYTGEPQLRKGVKGIPLPFTHLIPDNTSQTRECSRTGWYISFIWCCYWDKLKPIFSLRRVKLLSWSVCWKCVFWIVFAHA